MNSGLIVAMGLPGCGKSTVFKELGLLHGLRVFHEPEEEIWPAAVHKRETCGPFTAITWFRSHRVPFLFEADAIKRAGQFVLVDSYYDKLLSYYLGKDGMEWLIATGDPYFALTVEMAELDYKHLPDADVLVFFELDEETWHQFLQHRNRALDRHEGLLKSFRTQEYLRRAAEEYAAQSGAVLITFRQQRSTQMQAARELTSVLARNGVNLSPAERVQ
jgi:adenylate kinase family enzyme